MGATEIAFLPLSDPASATGQVHADLLETLRSAPGFQRCYWGVEVEDPKMMRWFLDWDSVDAHRAFMDSDIYKPFLDRWATLLGGSPMLYHAHFAPFPPTAVLSRATAPTTEIVSMYFPAGYGAAERERVDTNARALAAVVEREAPDVFRGVAGGWVEEEVAIPGSAPPETAALYVLLLGWTSVQAHLDFRETAAFKENSHLLRGAEGLKKIAVVHASLTEFPGVPS